MTAREQILLLHGIGMSPQRMMTLSAYFRWKGYDVLNIGYPSRKYGIADCASHVAEQLQDRTPSYAVVHSMGGLVLLDMVTRNIAPPLQRAVLVGTPFGGSEVADFLAMNRFYKSWYGPAGQELTTHHRRSLSAAYAPAAMEVGVISGTSGWEHLWFNKIMNAVGPHDSLVSVASTHIPGMKDHVTLAMPHGMLIEFGGPQALHFLRTGQFRKPTITAAP